MKAAPPRLCAPLEGTADFAEPRGIFIGLEPHQQYSKSPDGLERIYRLVDSPS